ncbi:MAG: type I-U CRISPR-associated protein Cas5/Cas6 [Verrucomicrobia bacterium]|nr:type I-U CRISPR-associated protein Cas5/Cas6 [Verrucomicrobiota bacterium]
MPLIISLRFPTERYVAASMTRRDEVEWPPHPARLMLGLLAAHHLGSVLTEERAALQWLCEQDPPVMLLPPAEHCVKQYMKGVFVPQNPSEAKDIKHPRKERSFPSVILPGGQASIIFHWPAAAPDDATRAALASLVGKLVRLGHSSSLVMGALADEIPDGEWQELIPLANDDPAATDHRLRVPWPGLLDSAERAFDANGREAELAAAFARRDNATRPLTKFEASPRGRYDARHVTCGYAARRSTPAQPGPWESGLCILTRTGGDRLGLDATWQVTSVLHRTILDRWLRHPEFGPVPAWISGHQPGNGAEATGPAFHNHLAMFPLAFVDSKHATGNLLGLGIAIPRPETIGLDKSVIRQQWRQLLGCLLENGKLSLIPDDHAWTLELGLSDADERREALQPSRWNAPATQWQSITPIILDRHPKPSLKKDPEAWAESCMEIITQACLRLGLPAPISVKPSLFSTTNGAPPAPAFVAPTPRPGRPARFHIHASITFAEPVAGPLLIGAGRFRGYGLMKPSPNKLS